jgi:single-strand DNA-binding protein
MLKLQVIGNVGQDAKVNETNGRQAINFTCAVNRKWKDKDQVQHETTNWINCTIWRDKGQSIEIAKYLTKGTKVFVEGRPDCHTYEDKEGHIVASLDVRAINVELLSAKPKENGESTANDQESQSNNNEDDLPF